MDSTSVSAERTLPFSFVCRLLAVVVLPIALVVALANLIVWQMAYTSSPDEIARLQHADPKLAWVGPTELFTAIKIARIKFEDPEIVVIGASRAGQFRSAMFEPYRFYNGAFSGWTFERQYQVLDLISKVHPPKIVIFNLEYLMFEADYERKWGAVESGIPLEIDYQGLAFIRNGPHWERWTRELLYSGRKSADPKFKFFGLTASVNSWLSFLYDGSTHYFPEATDPSKLPPGEPDLRNGRTILESVKKGDGLRMDSKQVERLRKLADLAERRHIVLVGVQLPFPKSEVDVLDAGKDFTQGDKTFAAADMGVWREFQSAQTKELLTRMGIVYFDMTHLPAVATVGTARGFIDPLHPGEYLVLSSVIEMLKDPRLHKLLPAIDLPSLEGVQRRAAVEGNYIDIFENNF